MALTLGVFLLGQQPFFPQTDEEWGAFKHGLAMRQGMLALTVAGLGALVEAGAVSNSGVLSLVEFLQAEVAPLQALRDKYLRASERLSRLAPVDQPARALITAELAELDQASRQAGEAVNQALRL